MKKMTLKEVLAKNDLPSAKEILGKVYENDELCTTVKSIGLTESENTGKMVLLLQFNNETLYDMEIFNKDDIERTGRMEIALNEDFTLRDKFPNLQ